MPGPFRTTIADPHLPGGITSLDDAFRACRASGLKGWDLVAYAQSIAARKFTYSRINPWDSPKRAFERGLGYCQQQAAALKALYDRLGIEAQIVHTPYARFPARVVAGVPEPERLSGHAWLSVTLDGAARHVDPMNDPGRLGMIEFEALLPPRPMSRPVFVLGHLGSVGVNFFRDLHSAALRASRYHKGNSGLWGLHRKPDMKE